MSVIKFFESTDAGAPTLNNAVGSMIAVLDACLITGYNTKSITSITVASGVATVACTAHGYANTYGKDIRIAGATGSFTALNKDTNIANVTTNGFTFLCPGVADGVATGAITAKYAPLGWTKQYSGTNKAMYKRSDALATGCMLRIDANASSESCRALAVSSATDIDTYTNPVPSAAYIAGGLGQYWATGNNSATPANWFIVGDSFGFYLFVSVATNSNNYVAHGFGDCIDFKPGSVLGTTLAGPSGSAASNCYSFSRDIAVPASWVILGAKDGVSFSAPLGIEARQASYGNAGPVYPSDVDGGLVISYPTLINEGISDGHKRAVQPGLAVPLASISSALSSKTQITNIVNFQRNFLVVKTTPAVGSSSVNNCMLIDLTGPWR